MRVALADDSALFRRGLSLILGATGIEITAEAATGPDLITAIAPDPPDVVIIDMRMPPTFTDEGIQTALRLRNDHRSMGVLVLSTYAEVPHAARLLAAGANGVGYLLKDRVDDVSTLRNALNRLTQGECVIDPDLVTRLLERRRITSDLEQLTTREQEVLRLIAEGRSNTGIAHQLNLSPKTVEANIAAIFAKLSLPPHAENNRRVLAAITWLRTPPPHPPADRQI